MSNGRLPTILASSLALIPAIAAAQADPVRFDQWAFYQENANGTARWQYRPRLYIPFALSGGWRFTQRADIPLYYTDATGPDNPPGNWSFHAADALVEEIIDTPDLAENFRLRASLRVVAPTGGRAPFGADQWQVAPGLGFNWRFPEAWRGITLAPYVRFFHGFDPQSPGVNKTRNLTLRPTVNIGMGEGWSPILFEEQPATFNDRTNRWFVPFEAMLARRVNRSYGFSFGGAYGLVDDNPGYRWLAQGRISFYF
ncbi:MAG: hypothetical protein FIB06_04620 [Betaproteobacteria bacterium]|nr:hypothetical protein [Betaproteobacteria bacterium]